MAAEAVALSPSFVASLRGEFWKLLLACYSLLQRDAMLGIVRPAACVSPPRVLLRIRFLLGVSHMVHVGTL